MSIDETLLFTFVIPIVAVAFSFFARSKVAKYILRLGGFYFFGSLSIAWALFVDCGFNNFQFGTCGHFPQGLAEFFTVVHLANLVLMAFVAPVLVLVAVLFEVLKRRN